MKILITDDDADIRKVLLLMLEQYGDCQQAEHGRESIKKLFEAWKGGDPFDLLCLDLDMPSINGLEVLKTLRGLEEELKVVHEKRTKVLVISAYEEESTREKVAELGCEGFIPKSKLNREFLHRALIKIGLTT